MSSTLFLRRILALDSASCAAMGLMMSLAASPLAPLLGLPRGLIFAAGAALLPLAAFIGWLASRPAPPRSLVWLVVLGNLAWTAESFVLLAQQAERITSLGAVFVGGQGLAVLALTLLEFAGLKRAGAVAA